MKKVTLFLLCILLLTTCMSVVAFADAPGTGYQMLFSDEFEGTELDTETWAYRTGGTNRKENIRVADGKLLIDYKKIDDNKTANSYTGGGVITREVFPYGYYETKAKTFNGVKGLHTSFWTASIGYNEAAPLSPQSNHLIEIDGFEFNSRSDGKTPVPAYNLHHWWGDHAAYGSKSYSTDTDGDDTTNDEFVMGFEFLPGVIVYYCNGQEVGRTANTMYSAENVWFTALAYYGVTAADIDDTKADANGLFGSSEYDYFRYYQKKLKGVNLLANPHFEFNRQLASDSAVKSFYTTGSVVVDKTPFAHNGFCNAVINKNSTLGKNFAYLSSGKYTFEGYFKAKENTVARLVAYDKNGAELKSIAIPVSSTWTLVSLEDIDVVDSAYVVVETTSGTVMADDLSFYALEGETGYENYKDTKYEDYTAIASPQSTATTITADQTTRSSQSWGSSSLTIDNLYTYAYSSKIWATLAGRSGNVYTDISASWETTLEKDGTYDVKVWNIQHSNNVPTQNYVVKVDGTAITDTISLTTLASADAGQWEKLATVTGTAGQKVTVTMTPSKPTDEGQNVRIAPVSIISHDDLLLETALIAQLNNPIYQYKGSPCAFDATATLYPYVLGTETYIPYQAIKSIVPIDGVADNETYVTATQINSISDYNVYIDKGYIVIYEKKYTASGSFINNAISSIANFNDTFLHIEKEAIYVGKNTMPFQTVYDTDQATLPAGWGTSSLGHGGSLYSGSSSIYADWAFSFPENGKYSVQIYNVVHAGNESAGPSTKAAGVTLMANGKTYTATLDQCDGQTGWHDLGTFEADAGITATLHFYNAAGKGILRADAIRVVPVFETPAYFNASDKANQTVISYASATKNEAWTDTENGIGYSENTDATITYTVSAPESKEYRLQMYAPVADATATSGAKIIVSIGEEEEYFLLDQTKSKNGWYELGVMDLETADTVTVSVSNFAGSGKLYAGNLRLIPAFEAPAFVNDKTAIGEEYYSYNTAQKAGAWQASTGAYVGCITSPDADASIAWTATPQKSTRYSIEVYVPKYTASGPSGATAFLEINGEPYYYTLYQRADSAENTGNGWYTLGTYDLKTADTVNVTLTNRTLDGWLRAKAIRLVPESAPIARSAVENPLYKDYYNGNDAEKTGEWIQSSGEYAGCYASSEADATLTYNMTPKADDNYEIEIFLPKYTDNATDSVAIDLEINGALKRYTVSLKPDSAEDTGSGWYTLGTYSLKTTDTVSLTISNNAKAGWLRAKDARLVPQKPDAVLVGNTSLPDQEFYNMNNAIKTGKWSTSSVGGSSYYGSDENGIKATATWNVNPKKTHLYSIQVFVPCIDQSSTTNNGYAILSVNGASHRFKLDQRKDTATYSGWYELASMNLTESDNISVEIGKNSGTYIRANAIRLVPITKSVNVKVKGTDTNVKASDAESYYTNVRTEDENGNTINDPTLLDALVAADKVSDIGIAPNLTLSDGTASALTFASMAISPDTYQSQNLNLTPGAGSSYAELWSGNEVFVDSGKTVTMQVNVPKNGTYHLVLSGNCWDTGRYIVASVDGTSFYSDDASTNKKFILGGVKQAGVYKVQSANGIALTEGYHTLTVQLSGLIRLNYAGLVLADSKDEAAAVQATFTTKEAFNKYMNTPVFDGTKLTTISVFVNKVAVTDNFDRYILSEGDKIELNLFQPISIGSKINAISENITHDGNRQLSDETFAKTNFVILLNSGSFSAIPVDTTAKDSMKGLYLNGYVSFKSDDAATSGDETTVYNYINCPIQGNAIDSSGRLVIALNLPSSTNTSFDGKTFKNLTGGLSEAYNQNSGTGYDFSNLYITDTLSDGVDLICANGKATLLTNKAQPVFVTVENADGSVASTYNFALNITAPAEFPISSGQTVYVWKGTNYIHGGTTAIPLCEPVTVE